MIINYLSYSWDKTLDHGVARILTKKGNSSIFLSRKSEFCYVDYQLNPALCRAKLKKIDCY
jgi:hypothetical protein